MTACQLGEARGRRGRNRAPLKPIKVCSRKPKCNDDNPDTVDSCHPLTYECIFTIKPIVECSNGVMDCPPPDVCHEVECTVDQKCVYPDIDCSDPFYCTVDTCDTSKYVLGDKYSACVHAPNPDCEFCPNGTPDCVKKDDCDETWCDNDSILCVHRTIECDDGKPCTDDSCDPAKGGCVHKTKPITGPDSCQTCKESAQGDTWQCLPRDCCHYAWCDKTVYPVDGLCIQADIVCDDGNKCHVGTCSNAICQCLFDALPDGTGCGTGKACQSGQCV